MKSLIALSLLLVTLSTQASVIKGVVKKFSGMTVETHRPYTYYALVTNKGSRLGLPKWINANKVPANASLTFDAREELIFCTDMSAACLTGFIVEVKSMNAVFAKSSMMVETFEGTVKQIQGMSVETNRPYRYFAVDAHEKIAVPEMFNANELYTLNPVMKVSGTPYITICTDMSAACGPTALRPVTSVEIKF